MVRLSSLRWITWALSSSGISKMEKGRPCTSPGPSDCLPQHFKFYSKDKQHSYTLVEDYSKK
jgi:hypothetical protein